MITSVPAAVRTSTHEVLPPKRRVWRPGVGIEPRVPQKRTCIEESLATRPDSLCGNCHNLREMRPSGPCVPPWRSMMPIRDRRLSSRVTASRWVLTRLAISAWVGAGLRHAPLPSFGARLANRSNSACMRLTARVLIVDALRQAANIAHETL